MRRMLVTTIVAATAGLAYTTTAGAQTVSLEVRGGLDRPISEFRDPGGWRPAATRGSEGT